MIALKRSRVKIAATAITILVLMLSSQVVGSDRSQTQQTSPQPSPPAIKATAPPVQSPPGEVNYTNTWNRTQSLACPPSSLAAATPEPLTAQKGQDVTLASTAPALVTGMSALSAQVVKDSYMIFSNGTFLASDGQGDELSWLGVTGLPAGATAIRLFGNATEAVQLYSVGPSGRLSANFTVAYRLMTTGACEPSGLGIVIQGTAAWPGSNDGTISVNLRGQKMRGSSTQADFGGHDGSMLVFDWSDSMKANPTTYVNSTSTVTWWVGGSFKIDPTLLTQSDSQQALNWGDQRRLWHTTETNGTAEYWAFYYDGTNIDKAWSLNGVTWHSSLLDTVTYGVASGSQFSSWVYDSAGTYRLLYALGDPHSGGFWLGTAQLGQNGAVSGLTRTLFATTGSGPTNTCVYGSSSEDIIAGVATTKSGSYQLEVYTINPANGLVLSKTVVGTGAPLDGCIVLGLSSGYALLYGAASTASPTQVITSANGIGWSASTASPTTSAITLSSAVSVGNMVGFATGIGASVQFWSCTYPCASFSPVQDLASQAGGALLDNVVLSTNARAGGQEITATYHDLNEVWSRTSQDGGNSWTPPQVIAYDPSLAIVSGSLQGDYDYVQSVVATADVAWTTGTSAPYSVWFPAFPVIVPSAATTSDPWAVGGFSPYESYFSQLNEYVSPGNGLLGVSQTDLSVPGRSPALSVTRVFSTPSAFVGTADPKTPYAYDNYTMSDLGVGWELGFPWIGTYYFHPGDGESIPLSFNSTGVMEYHGAITFVLYKNANDTYTLFTSDGTRYHYAGVLLTSITSPDSPFDILTFTYNNSPGYITQIRDGEGRVATFSYNANNTLASISSGGLTWRYTYKGSDLSSVIDPPAAAGESGRATHYIYDSSNPWLISEIVYPTGAATFYTYDVGPVAPDVSTYVVSTQAEYSSDNPFVEARENTYTFSMVDGAMVADQVLYRNGSAAVQGSTAFDFRQVSGKYEEQEYQEDQSGNVLSSVETTFDQRGEPNGTTIFSPKGAVLASSVTHYDNWGNVNFTQDYDGHDVYYAYANTQDRYQFGNGKTGLIQNFTENQAISEHIHDDLLGSAEFQDAANSKTPIETFYVYDNLELLKQVQLYSPSPGVNSWLTTSYAYDPFGNLETSTDSLHEQTCYAYSSAYDEAYLTSEMTSGSLNSATAPNVTVSYAYNFTNGEMTSETDGEGNTTYYAHDNLGRETSVTLPAVNGVTAKTSYSYDDATNIVTATDPKGNITKDYYDGLGRLVQEQTYLSPTSPYSSEYYTYDWLGQVLTDEGPNGAVTSYAYDSLGRETGVLNPDGSHESISYNDTMNTETVIDGDGHETQNVYDFMQQLTSVREYWSVGGYNSTSYTYDGVGNLVKVVGPDAGQVTQNSYDDLNRLVKTTYADGTTASSNYNAVGELMSSTDQERRVTTYSYDFLGQLLSVNYPDGTSTSYTYDKDGNVLTMDNAVDQVKYSYDSRDELVSEKDTIGGTAYSLSYAYDADGNVQSMTYPDGSKVGYSYDALDRVTKVAGGSASLASFTYNPDGTVKTMTYGNGEVTSYFYDSMSRPTSIVASLGSTQELSLSYKYDGDGNVVSVNSESYGYDALDRLASSSGPWGTTSYSYDAAGSMVKQTSGSGTTLYTYNTMDELVRSGTAGGAATYSYDGDGDLVIKNDGTNVWTYEYNTQSELTKVLENGVVVQQNYYDGSGDRVEQTAGGVATVYLYAGDSVVYEKNLKTGVAEKHVYADGARVASITSAATLFLSVDLVGSVRLGISGSSVVYASDYVPYGVQYGTSGSTEFTYAGMLYDSATGLYYDNARFYDPTTGRFLTADPLAGVQSDPQSMNGYAYARDNPLAIGDPSGLSWNPLTWSPFSWLLLGAAVGLTLVSAAQGGLDPVTDALDAAAISDFVGTAIAVGASAAGLPVIELSTEGPELGMDQWLASLTAQQFNDYVMNEGNARYRTEIILSRLASELGGTTEVEDIPTKASQFPGWIDNPFRAYDFKTDDLFGELKVAPDSVNDFQLQKDLEIIKSGKEVEYFLVDNPVTGRPISVSSIVKLIASDIPYTQFTWDQFLEML